MTTRAEALRDHDRIVEEQRLARHSTETIERRAKELAALRSAEVNPDSRKPGRARASASAPTD